MDAPEDHSDIGPVHLAKYAAIFREAPSGPVVEFGTLDGGSALLWLELMDPQYPLFTVDPYGDRPYFTAGHMGQPESYGDEHYVKQKVLLARYPNHTHFKMTSHDFLRRVVGTDHWMARSVGPIGDFTFAFLDGDHAGESVLRDVLNLKPFMQKGGVILVDNVDWGDGLAQILAKVGPVVRHEERFIAIRVGHV